MNKKIISFHAALFLLLFYGAGTAIAQTDSQKKQIMQHYDLAKIDALKEKFLANSKREKAQAYEAAKNNNWEIFRKNENGSFDELMMLSPDGKPMYYTLDNINAAKTVRTIHLNSGGSLGLTLDGQGMRCGIWDGGPARLTHREFAGRVTSGDGFTQPNVNSYHPTHIAGTIGGSGIDPAAKGIAPLATMKVFDWNNDLSEALEEARNGMLLSNHSYGFSLNLTGYWLAGSYSPQAYLWDELAYNVPYYLMVTSAGNEGNVSNPQPTTPGYDKLVGMKNAKNNLVVANCNDANVDNEGNILLVALNTSSSEGPTDDNRIKPDITANGTQVYSSFDSSDDDYDSLSGSSMSAPGITGSLLLLQQHHNNLNSRFMKAATIKGLACHTADDKGRPGPDALWGWGVMNAKKAAQAISQNGQQSWISEETLKQGETFTFTATSDGINPLVASISWTDVPGTPTMLLLNDPTPVLVNDLDIRITKDGITYFPWKLESVASLPATNTSDNHVDNIERINIDAPAGTYTITVTHKGTLQGGSQDFGFVVTGLTSAFSITSLTDTQKICPDGNAIYNFRYNTSNTAASTLTASGLPFGATATFFPQVINASGSFSLDIFHLDDALPGIYPIIITANNGTESESRTVMLEVIISGFENIILNHPANGQTAMPLATKLQWNPSENTEIFRVEVATDPGFANIFSEGITSDAFFHIENMAESTTYYWRVSPLNSCGAGASSVISNFQTGRLVCNKHFEAADYNNAAISTQANTGALIRVPVFGNFTIADIKINYNLTHPQLGEIGLYLDGPMELAWPPMTLLHRVCDGGQNINCTFDDAGNDLACNPASPSISGSVKPYHRLSDFNGFKADGTWLISAFDYVAGNGGLINHVSIDFCTIEPALGVKENHVAAFEVYPNPGTGIFNIRMASGVVDGGMALTLFDVQGRKILSQSSRSASEVLNIETLQNGVYLLSIENGTHKTTKKIILNK